MGQLKGEFCHNFGFGVECVIFLDSNKFEYSHNHCTGHDKGKGVYSIRGNNLTLQFQTDTTNDTKYKVSIQKVPTNSDTITVEVNVFSFGDNEPLIAANTYVKDVTGNRVYGTATDFDGHGIFKVPTTLVSPVLVIQYLGYATYSDTISLDSNYKITILLKTDFGKLYNSVESKTFKIKDIKKRSVSLKHDYKDAIYTTYERK
jgi:hypothetical protein